MQWIINADDFGLSQEVNSAVVQCFRDGTIDRTTLLVNMPQTDAACALAREHGFFDRVGLHINLVEGTPLTALAAHGLTGYRLALAGIGTGVIALEGLAAWLAGRWGRNVKCG